MVMNAGLMLSLVLSVLSLVTSAVDDVHPVIIIPGLGGSVLEAKLTNKPPYRDCKTDSDWYTVWFSSMQAAFRYDCFNSVFALNFTAADASSASAAQEVVNMEGVEIRPRDFGGVDGIEYCNSGSHGMPIPYMVKLVDTLVSKVGLKKGKSVRAATYDFRMAGDPVQTQRLYKRLKGLIEETYEMNDQFSVHLLAHSLGGPFTTAFLNSYVAVDWKVKYIASFVTLSGPFLGTPLVMESLVSGPNYDYVPQVIPAMLVPVLRTIPANLWMMPVESEELFTADTTIITTPSQNYTAQRSDLKAFVAAVGSPILTALFDSAHELVQAGTKPPGGVPVFCGYAVDTVTHLRVRYDGDDLSTDFRVHVEETTMGDGTVNLPSLRYCAGDVWGKDTKVVKEYDFGGSLSAHTNIVQHPPLLEDLVMWLKSDWRK